VAGIHAEESNVYFIISSIDAKKTKIFISLLVTGPLKKVSFND
jgi:hypothetical protein